MTHYSFLFKYNFDPEKREEIEEHFIPFSLNDLEKLKMDGHLNNSINLLKKTQKNKPFPIDSYIENSELRSENNFTLIPFEEEEENYFGETGIWKVSLWDLLSDANLIKYVADIHQEKEGSEEIKKLAEVTFCSQVEMFIKKIKISLLLHLDAGLRQELIYINNENGYIEQVNRDIDFCNIIDKILHNNSFEYNRQELEDAINGDRNPDNNGALEIKRSIVSLVNINGDQETTQDQRNANWISINELNKRLKKIIRKPFDIACYYYDLETAIINGQEQRRIKRDINSLRRFLSEKMEQTEEEGKKWKLKAPYLITKYIAENITDFMNHTNAICNHNYEGTTHFNNINNDLGGGIFTKYFKGKYLNGKGCFSLLITNSTKHYFAVSGMKEELKKYSSRLITPIRYIMEHILNKRSVPDIYVQNYTYNYAFIENNLDVRRYTDIVTDATDYIGRPGPYISPFETYRQDYINNPTEDYNRTYSCCERKMLAYSGYDDVKYIFSRWAPCWKCCPAICDTKNVRVFGFGRPQDIGNNGYLKEFEIKEYIVSNKTSYDVKEK